MLTLEGKLVFDPVNVSKKHHAQSSWKKVALAKLDCDIDSYYAWFLEKRFSLKLVAPLRGAHVTIISDMVDSEIYSEAFQYFHGKSITFEYDPAEVRTNGQHWWLKMYSTDSQNIRRAMGLTPDPYFSLHLTLGLANEKNIDHSKYILECITRYGL